MTKEKIAVIHCGFHKTASSSIQHTLAKNRKVLQENGWSYPEIRVEGKTFYNQSIPLYGYYCERPENFKHYWYHNEVSHEIANAEICSKLTDTVWKKPRLIFSDEFISRLDLRALSALKADFQTNGYTIRVIAFVREPVDLATSNIQQKVRNKEVDAIIKSLNPFSGIEKIKNLTEVFGADAEFYNFERACRHDAGPAGFFFELIGVPLHSGQTVRVNDGMSLQAVRLLSYLNSRTPLFVGKSSVHPLRSRRDADVLTKLPGEKFQLTAEQKTKIKSATEQARSEMEKLLGVDFFPEDRSRPEPVFVWGAPQFDFLDKVFDDLDLHILLRICDFLLELNDTEHIDNKRIDTFLTRIRSRIDVEKNRESDRDTQMKGKIVTVLNAIKRILRHFR
ncbi:MAG: hypothetical protein QMD11_01510 [Smithella sp.]|nr:hypothetical protein [Smithella sp.]